MNTYQEFEDSLTSNAPPAQMPVFLQALWFDAKGNWDKAHSLVDHLSGKTASRVHAYLHRVEGDQWNANYWYTKAGEPLPAISLAEERKMLVQRLLTQQ